MKKILSVIIPTYNRAEFIAEAIDSVLNQDYGQYQVEVVVVDDGSTDGTEQIVKKYSEHVRYENIAHSGLPSVARNIGLHLAKGEIVAFQDSDDKWPKDKISRQLPLFDNPEVVMTYGQAKIMDASGSITHENVVLEKNIKNGESFKALLTNNGISTLTVMARREALLSVGAFDESPALRAVEDYQLWLKMSAKYESGIIHIDDVLAYYRRHDNNISHADGLLATERILAVYNSLWRLDILSPSQRKALENQIAETTNNHGHLLSEKYGNPTISVVMSVYNGERYLRQAIESILAQTYKNFEFIIIDDGSKDDSVNIINSFDDRRIRLIHQENHGLVYSLNKAISHANGEYIARMDADDISMPSRFEKELVLFSSNSRLGLVSGFFAYIDDTASRSLGTVIVSPTKHLDLRRMLYINNPFAHGCTMFKKDAYESAGTYRDTYGPTEDFDLWRRIADHEYELALVPDILYLYRINPQGISATKQKIQHEFSERIVEEQWQKPFVYKGFRSLLRDGRDYRTGRTPFSARIFDAYAHQQFLLTKEMFLRGWFKRALVTALAVIWLDHRKSLLITRLIAGGVLRKLKLKPIKQTNITEQP